jgi:aryl-alcohol dehydrogenase-like predicted oxidoreductase
MELRTLGSRGPAVSLIGYGGWEAGGTGWGAGPPEGQVAAAIRTGFDMGINWVDTAEIYGNGRSEELIGRAIRDRPDVMVFTKVASAPRGTGYEPLSIRRAAEASLSRLRRDVIDLYQLHWSDETAVPLEETWGAMADLADAGLVRWVGVSNFTRELIERCERIRHVDSLQPHLSMLWQERLPLLEFCLANGTGVIAYGPLAFGLLTGAIGRETTFPDDDWRSGGHGLRAYDQLFASGRFESNLEVVEALRPIAKRLDVSLAQLALAWLLHQDGVTGVISGSRSPEHVRENAAAWRVSLSTERRAEIDRILQKRAELVVR